MKTILKLTVNTGQVMFSGEIYVLVRTQNDNS